MTEYDFGGAIERLRQGEPVVKFHNPSVEIEGETRDIKLLMKGIDPATLREHRIKFGLPQLEELAASRAGGTEYHGTQLGDQGAHIDEGRSPRILNTHFTVFGGGAARFSTSVESEDLFSVEEGVMEVPVDTFDLLLFLGGRVRHHFRSKPIGRMSLVQSYRLN